MASLNVDVQETKRIRREPFVPPEGMIIRAKLEPMNGLVYATNHTTNKAYIAGDAKLTVNINNSHFATFVFENSSPRVQVTYVMMYNDDLLEYLTSQHINSATFGEYLQTLLM